MLIAASLLGLALGIAWVTPKVRGLVAEFLALPDGEGRWKEMPTAAR
jgi:hypothetical protein